MEKKPTPVLYFSNNCQYCKEIMGIIQKSDFRNSIKTFCVDRQRAPPFITSVPSLVLDSQNLLVGENVFNWFEQQNKKKSANMEPAAWHHNEMGNNFSDNYSFLESTNESSNISHNFSFLENSNQIINPPNESTNQSSSKSDELTRRMEAMQQARDGDIPGAVTRI